MKHETPAAPPVVEATLSMPVRALHSMHPQHIKQMYSTNDTMHKSPGFFLAGASNLPTSPYNTLILYLPLPAP